jgi:hypothetical protein
MYYENTDEGTYKHIITVVPGSSGVATPFTQLTPAMLSALQVVREMRNTMDRAFARGRDLASPQEMAEECTSHLIHGLWSEGEHRQWMERIARRITVPRLPVAPQYRGDYFVVDRKQRVPVMRDVSVGHTPEDIEAEYDDLPVFVANVPNKLCHVVRIITFVTSKYGPHSALYGPRTALPPLRALPPPDYSHWHPSSSSATVRKPAIARKRKLPFAVCKACAAYRAKLAESDDDLPDLISSSSSSIASQ